MTHSKGAAEPKSSKLWLLIPVLGLILLVLLGSIGVGAWLFVGRSVDRVQVRVDNVRVTLEDKRGKPLGSSGGLLNPTGTLNALRNGFARVSFDVYANNKNAFDLSIERVDYTVRINDTATVPGTWPNKGKGPTTLRAQKTHREPISVKVPLKKLLVAGGLSPTLHILVQGEAQLIALRVPFSHTFKEQHTHNNSPKLPIPFP